MPNFPFTTDTPSRQPALHRHNTAARHEVWETNRRLLNFGFPH
jgi:hypothetical protein